MTQNVVKTEQSRPLGMIKRNFADRCKEKVMSSLYKNSDQTTCRILKEYGEELPNLSYQSTGMQSLQYDERLKQLSLMRLDLERRRVRSDLIETFKNYEWSV